MPDIIVRELDLLTEGSWSFADSRLRWSHRQGLASFFDPFPCYRHDMNIAQRTARRVQDLCPPLWDVELFVANREADARTNGFSHAHDAGHYDSDGKWIMDLPVGLIMLAGKRIPPHPAMTRYLVAHEYGHHVEYMLQRLRGHSLHGSEVVTEYAELRKLPAGAVHHGAGGTWHSSAAEIFACDFRIIVCGIETEYWPHPGVMDPEMMPIDDLAPLAEWWADVVATIKSATIDSLDATA